MHMGGLVSEPDELVRPANVGHDARFVPIWHPVQLPELKKAKSK